MIFDATRPVILNGIEDIVTRPDLADRGLFLQLQPIPEASRRTEAEFWQAFRQDCPKILGALLDCLVHGLQQLPTTKLNRHPRMADFARWATACETAVWPSRYLHGRLHGKSGAGRWTVSLRRIPWRRHSVPGWPTKPNGLGRRPTS